MTCIIFLFFSSSIYLNKLIYKSRPMSALTIEDRYPLQSQRGNFSGKASTFIRSLIEGEWWRSSPTTGDVPDTVERNAQFHINQGPVDMEILNAKPTQTPSSLGPNSLIGTFLPRSVPGRTYTGETTESKWKEYFIWHVGTKQSDLPFSTIPTKY